MSENVDFTLGESCRYKVIYIYRITQTASHAGFLKIGDTTLHGVPAGTPASAFPPNCDDLRRAAEKRVRDQVSTAGFLANAEILHTELAVRTRDGRTEAFRDMDVHRVLKNSGVETADFDGAREWFRTDLETAKKAVAAVKEGRFMLAGTPTRTRTPVELRPEQKNAVERAAKHFSDCRDKGKGGKFLWNAKMRFGKTLSALQLVKELGLSRTIIVTHRPAVKASWFEDFEKIFYESDTPYLCGGRGGASFEALAKSDAPFVYFASIQDLRGSETVAENGIDKNAAVFGTDWELVIVDEAHEGTQTALGAKVLAELRKPSTCTLALSGTPFNVIENYSQNETYTWDYIMEQQAKREWEKNHPCEPNPYAALPTMNIRTYSLGELLNRGDAYVEVEDKAFNFSEFFRTDDVSGKFVHEKDVVKFLDLLVGKSSLTREYPFANDAYRAQFRHTFWVVPGVKSADALTKLLEKHDVFGNGAFEIVNVAGDGNVRDGDGNANSLSRVQAAIKAHERTITISCGRLTTGVTVPEWTAVLYLSGSYHTSPASYMQTIFRVQSPGSVDGRAKEECYAFDFAPDRTISIVEQVAQFSAGREKRAAERERRVSDFIREFTNFAPVIAFDGSETKRIDTAYVLNAVKQLCIAQVVKKGFASPRLFNNRLWHLTDDALEVFKGLEKKIGKHAASAVPADVVINAEGLDNPTAETDAGETPEGDEPEPTPRPNPPTDADEKTRRKNRETAIAVLLNATVRIPLLVFGADDDGTPFTAENFAGRFDDRSWAEFMGKLTKEDFTQKVAPYLEETIFTGACSRIRERVRAADSLPPRERIRKIVELHSEFKNPDKETVLTPWRVVCRQISDTLGGYDFWNETHDEELLTEPRFVSRGNVTDATLANPDAFVLEINSKTGLYPLCVAYSIMRAKLASAATRVRRDESVADAERRLWKTAVEDNLYIVCRTQMAAKITRRTLLGFDETAERSTNILVRENLTERARNENTFPRLVAELLDPATWNLKSENAQMKFNAIVGNPPYQQSDGGAQASATPIYQHFVRLAKALEPEYISMIMPARWYAGGKGLDDFRAEMLADTQIRVLVDYFDSSACFPGVEIKGGVCYLLWERDKRGQCRIISERFGKRTESTRPLLDETANAFIRFKEAIPIIQKVFAQKFDSFEELVSPRKPFGLGTNAVGGLRTATRKIRLFANKRQSLRCAFIKETEITAGSEWVNAHKVLISYAYGAGDEFPHQILNVPFYAPPNSACTETYLVVGPFESKEVCENVMSYMRTKFFRFLVLQKKNTQHATKSVYSFVPVQDFSKPWTDAELYAKYDLTADEIAFIESMIRPMPPSSSA